jgi:hypothetical protein
VLNSRLDTYAHGSTGSGNGSAVFGYSVTGYKQLGDEVRSVGFLTLDIPGNVLRQMTEYAENHETADEFQVCQRGSMIVMENQIDKNVVSELNATGVSYKIIEIDPAYADTA